MKKMLTVLLLVFLSFFLFAGGNKEDSNVGSGKKAVEFEFVATQPEYVEQDKQIWELYMEKNPHVTVKVIAVNEDQRTALLAKIAANEAPAIMAQGYPVVNKTNYTTYANLLNIDYPYWDQLSYDGKGLFESETGVKDYVPGIQLFNTTVFSFVYYKDEMEKAGLDPTSMKTWDDVDNFLAELKKYVDKTDGIDYVLDTGWHSWVWMTALSNLLSLSLGAESQDLVDLYMGKIAWTDLENNPMVPFFEKIKEYYNKGYLPENFLQREWENDFEASFISRKSIMTLHGHWIWNKVLAADPSAKLGGVPLPANDGKLATYPVSSGWSSSIFAQYEGTEDYDEIVKAFIWYNSPEVAEMRAQFEGKKPNFKTVSSDFTIGSPQFVNVLKPALDGKFGSGLTWDSSIWGLQVAGPYRVEGTPDVLQDDAMTEPLGKYFSGDMSLKEFMTMLQKRWENAYSF